MKIAHNRADVDYRCPRCGAQIPLADVNVASDLALCRACGQTSSFASLTGFSEIPNALPPEPPRWVKVEDGFFGGKTITYRRPSPILFFLVPFTALWSGGSMAGLYIVPLIRGEFEWDKALFGIPFLIGTVILLAVIAYLGFGKCEVTLENSEGKIFTGVGSLGWKRQFRYGTDTIVALKLTNMSVNNVKQTGIAITNPEKEIVFGTLLTKPAKLYLAAAIREESRKTTRQL